MKILVGIPMLYGAEHCRRCLDGVLDEYGVDVLVIENGADDNVKQMLCELHRERYPTGNTNFMINQHAENIFVNPAWNEIMEFFMRWPYDHLVILNSDFILQPGWSRLLRDGISCVPTDGSHLSDVVVTEGTPGVFIHLTQAMAKLVYPIPTPPLIWFGDEWIYSKLRAAGYDTVVRAGLIGLHYHNGSQTVQRLPGISELIEQDKVSWGELVNSGRL